MSIMYIMWTIPVDLVKVDIGTLYSGEGFYSSMEL